MTTPDDQPRGAVAVITNDAGELLLHLRDDIPTITWPGHWSVLGGGCDPGESPRAAIVRELQEEAGLALPPDAFTELFEVPDVHGSGQLITVFAVQWNGDAQALPLGEGVKLDWVAPDQLPGLTIPPFIRDAINRCLTKAL
ncbi:NUDIX domain-containing protein [Streptomonospora nanhaiensis]|uniref:NUDIX hydrolase n=1 Tax=Streptomonospora nanhaiensis TaxID=1323731 RepID=UPI001C3928C0|nr:NUDIX hydrolase [Streptomonospora nanhaiensis]MBV2364973.1 NUDIX hydrolase [Streptomonospora nanhaiensis]MBX9389805.1 NUDIX hydrolase [Streptomonospora nanhaiensis]